MENSKVKISKATYFNSRIECRIANPAMFQNEYIFKNGTKIDDFDDFIKRYFRTL
jgi:hypothetical protein